MSTKIMSWVRAHLLPLRRSIVGFLRPSSFSLPLPLSSAVLRLRIRRNLQSFRVHYLLLQWVLLLLSLLRAHRASMLFLMAASKFALLYDLLLKAIPATWPRLRRLLGRRLLLPLFLLLVLAELFLTDALSSLALALAVGAPLVLAHAVFRDADPDEGGDGDRYRDRDLEEGASR